MRTDIVCEDCLQELPKLPEKSIDLILTDLPYGVTANPADKALPLDILWAEWKRLLKADGVVVLTSQFPYTIDLIQSNRAWFRYDLIWDKVIPTGHLNANVMPMRVHEHIIVFSEKKARYYPQKQVGARAHNTGVVKHYTNNDYGNHKHSVDNNYTHLKYPQSIIRLPKANAAASLHPTEKPVALAEYLIKTFTQENDTVLDCCMGVGWTAVASKKLNRNFVGCDINTEYIIVAKQRVAEVPAKLELFTQLSPIELRT